MRTPALATLFLLVILTNDTRAQSPDLSGSWPSGYWRADRTGHTGPLRAEFTRISDCQYRAVFRGRFARIIPFRYSVRLDVVGQDGEKVLLGGSSWLPLFWRFEYNATATTEEFVATFKSRSDSGTFVLRRGCGGCLAP